MAQANLFLPFKKLIGNANAPAGLDAAGLLMTSDGGVFSALNQTVQAVIKATPGRVGKIIISAPGATSGTFAINDCATIGAIAAGNLVWELAFGATANVEGAIFALDFPCLVGIVLTVPGGSPICSVSYS